MIHIEFEPQRHRAAAYDGDLEIGEVSFAPTSFSWIIDHSEVDPDYAERGLARRMVELIVDHARDEGRKLRATCSYAINLFEASAEYDDVVMRD